VLFDATLYVGYRQGTITGSQDVCDGPVDDAMSEPLRLGRGRERPAPASARILRDPFQNSPKG